MMKSIILSVLLAIVWLSQPAQAATRLGLHVTQEELDNWRIRAVSGPYKSVGDVSTNSPGDWDKMVTEAASFASSPLAEIWQGQTPNNPWLPDGHFCDYTAGDGNESGCNPRTGQARKVASAAFVSMVQPQNFNHCSAVRTFIMAQIVEPGTDFTNTTRWPNQQLGDGWSGGISTMFTRMAYAYDYCRIISPSTFSAGDTTSIETWFSNAAFYWARNTNYSTIQAVPNRNTDYDTSVAIGNTYPTDVMGSSPGNAQQLAPTHYDCTLGVPGNVAGGWTEVWANRSTVQVRFAAVGSMLRATPSANDLQSQRWVKMWFKEWLIYAVFSNNMVNDFHRRESPQNGWQYVGNSIGTLATVVDLFARQGDTSLYDFSTSAGRVWSSNPSGFNGNTNGGPKSFGAALQRHASFVNQRSTGVPGWNGASTNAQCGNVSYLIQPQDDVTFGVGSSTARIEDTKYPHANMYYRDNNIKLAYTRQLSGAPAYPQFAVTNDNEYAYSGGWWEHVGVLFLFGQMEDNAANPHLTSSPPSGTGQLELRIIRKLQ
jgi:hypothetical protein